jgi:hypothetical protein
MTNLLRYLKPAMLIFGLLVLGSLVRNLFRPQPGDAVTADSWEILKATQPFKEALARRAAHDSLWLRTAQQAQREALQANDALRATRARLAGLLTAPDTIAALDSIILTQERLLVLSDQRCSALDSAFRGCSERAALWEQRAAILDSALRRQVGVSSCKVLFVPCLSRVQALEVGLIIGGITGYLVFH